MICNDKSYTRSDEYYNTRDMNYSYGGAAIASESISAENVPAAKQFCHCMAHVTKTVHKPVHYMPNVTKTVSRTSLSTDSSTSLHHVRRKATLLERSNSQKSITTVFCIWISSSNVAVNHHMIH